MIVRLLKVLFLGAATYYATRTAVKQAKLLAIRKEAQEEMNRIEASLKSMHQTGESGMVTQNWDDQIRQYNKWVRVHAKTF